MLPTGRTMSLSPGRCWRQWPALIPILVLLFLLFFFFTWENKLALTWGILLIAERENSSKKNPSIFQLRKSGEGQQDACAEISPWSSILQMRIINMCRHTTEKCSHAHSDTRAPDQIFKFCFPPWFEEYPGKNMIIPTQSSVLMKKNETAGLLCCWCSGGFAVRSLSIRLFLF